VLGLALAALTADARSEQFILVRNAKNGTASVTRTQVKELATGKKKAWPHGPPAVLVLTRPGTPELTWFATSAVGLPASTLMAKIREQVFKGEMRKPITASSEQDVFAAVANDEGALGVVHAEAAKNLPPGVALLTLQ
jgi:ABC-type phosphate transport system substrate-binding protein